MKGLALSRSFYETYWRDMEEKLRQEFGTASAYGLVGEGSECFGFDDEISRDHHWGAGLCIWLPDHAPREAVDGVNKFYRSLPDVFLGYPVRKPAEKGERRIGAFHVSTFVHHLLGVDDLPSTLQEWWGISEYALATMVNGAVFQDRKRIITPVRDHFFDYYPQDARIKKIAGWAMIMGQAGQYNYSRCLKRKDLVTAHYVVGLFMEATAGMIHGLNRRFMPYYKWMHHSLETLPVLGKEAHETLKDLAVNMRDEEGMWANVQKIEELSWKVVLELKTQGLTDQNSDFLFDQGPVINTRIQDEELRNMPLFLSK
ncbi:DUF4037 domain-containing protein [Alkalibacter rhizosphaerae]|uniref:DUF4037 domain-containing protein n=1 Tax=Alkalibacter rhizosphaerae TaxID=2815577 RepID=A0A974XIV4_9FIRM|nr:DUF4037 domain-containing protein [Alkalibacter rhizosphaerae]QSX09183.1 DUF4037 domain-containing protein [Alkalibacter rhizosphaerae]